MKNVLLVIADGLGMAKNSESNAVSCAKTPNLDALMSHNPCAFLEASGESVGLPAGQMGNSEVGHMNMGAGRTVYQDLTYINKSIDNGDFYKNKELLSIMNAVKSDNSALHLMGLVSDGGVHSHINHLVALLKLAKLCKVQKVCVHVWTDGRDTLPTSSAKYVESLQNFIIKNKIGEISTVCGRFYSMDRDKNFERTKAAYNAIAYAQGKSFENPQNAVKECLSEGITDEFILPLVSKSYKGISPQDAVICFNFRPDRARQITKMFVQKDFCESLGAEKAEIKKYACFTTYDKNIHGVSVVFKPRSLNNTLGEYLSKNGFTQFRIAETEKYAHVTFFFNGGIEKPYKNEERAIVDSPKVKTYDLKPEMSARKIIEIALEKIKSKKYNLIVLNFANADMVGHTGNFAAAVKAVETVDECIGKLIKCAGKEGCVGIITADHGNAEKMADENGNVFTAHTLSKVPFIVSGFECNLKKSGTLCNIAPTILEILEIAKPCEMTAESLII